MAGLIVTAPLVIAKAPNGSDVYLYRGAVVPEGLADGEADRFEQEGFALRLPDPEPASVVLPTEGLPDDSWKVEQIDAYAEARGIDFPAGTKKADKLEQLAEHGA